MRQIKITLENFNLIENSKKGKIKYKVHSIPNDHAVDKYG
jgi:hypothetical protein